MYATNRKHSSTFFAICSVVALSAKMCVEYVQFGAQWKRMEAYGCFRMRDGCISNVC